jgi:predicted DCC family thiol-disulfide oxidoreductase YuxK
VRKTKDTLKYVIFDGHCSVCTQLAETIQGLSIENLMVLSIHDSEARALLDQAYPKGWKHAPYLLSIEQDKVDASTGIVGAFKLAKIIGVRQAWRIWRMAHRQKVWNRLKLISALV